MRGRTHQGPVPHLRIWLGTNVWRYWRVQRVTDRYLLLVPRGPNEGETWSSPVPVIDPFTKKRSYVLVRMVGDHD